MKLRTLQVLAIWLMVSAGVVQIHLGNTLTGLADFALAALNDWLRQPFDKWDK